MLRDVTVGHCQVFVQSPRTLFSQEPGSRAGAMGIVGNEFPRGAIPSALTRIERPLFRRLVL